MVICRAINCKYARINGEYIKCKYTGLDVLRRYDISTTKTIYREIIGVNVGIERRNISNCKYINKLKILIKLLCSQVL